MTSYVDTVLVWSVHAERVVLVRVKSGRTEGQGREGIDEAPQTN